MSPKAQEPKVKHSSTQREQSSEGKRQGENGYNPSEAELKTNAPPGR